MPICLVDLDETSVQWSCHFQDWIETKGYQPVGNLRETHSVENLIGVSREEAIRLTNEFNMSDHLRNQLPEPDALEVLPQLHKDGWKFVAITACGIDPGLRVRRREHLEEIFGFTWEVHTVVLHEPKREILKLFEPTVWVEDNKAHAQDGAALGHRAFLLDRPYNQNSDETVTRVRDWHDIARAIG